MPPQVFYNLVGNSCKFTHSGHICISVTSPPHSNMVDVEVSPGYGRRCCMYL